MQGVPGQAHEEAVASPASTGHRQAEELRHRPPRPDALGRAPHAQGSEQLGENASRRRQNSAVPIGVQPDLTAFPTLSRPDGRRPVPHRNDHLGAGVGRGGGEERVRWMGKFCRLRLLPSGGHAGLRRKRRRRGVRGRIVRVGAGVVDRAKSVGPPGTGPDGMRPAGRWQRALGRAGLAARSGQSRPHRRHSERDRCSRPGHRGIQRPARPALECRPKTAPATAMAAWPPLTCVEDCADDAWPDCAWQRRPFIHF